MCLESSAILSSLSVASVQGISGGKVGPCHLQRKRQSQWPGSRHHSYVWVFPSLVVAYRHSQFCIPVEEENKKIMFKKIKIKIFTFKLPYICKMVRQNWSSKHYKSLLSQNTAQKTYDKLNQAGEILYTLTLSSFYSSQGNQKKLFALQKLILDWKAYRTM